MSKLLTQIHNQGEEAKGLNKTSVSIGDTSNIKINVKKNRVSESERREIEEFYSGKGLHVNEIKTTALEDYFLIELNDGKKEIIELGGFNPIIVPEEKVKRLSELKNLIK